MSQRADFWGVRILEEPLMSACSIPAKVFVGGNRLMGFLAGITFETSESAGG